MRIEKETVQPGEVVPGVQICPFGTWPKAEKRDQVCDAATLQAVVDAWKEDGEREVLCDFEHRSEEPSEFSDTAAAAWISNLSVDPARGLVGDFKFTAAGAAAVTDRRLRFLSPVFMESSGVPSALRSVALTNKPNIPVEPVLNKAGPGTETEVEEPESKESPGMDKLKELLGLAPDASDEDVFAAVKALKDNEVALNKEKEEAEAEAFAEKHEDVCNKDALKSAYLLNKEAARKMVDGFVQPAQAPQKVLNKGAAQAPALPHPATGLREQMAALPPGERAAFYKAHAAEF